MTSRSGFYQEFIPKFVKRFFLLGLPACTLFLLFWYKAGGYDLWSSFLELPLRMLSFVYDIHYDPANSLDNAAFYYTLVVDGVGNQISYKVNNHSPNLLVVVLLLCSWPYDGFWTFFKVACWVFVFTVCYQIGSTWLQIYWACIGPDLADRFKWFWEETLWIRVVDKAQGFDKFILRYYAALPIFAFALTANYFSTQRGLKKGRSR